MNTPKKLGYKYTEEFGYIPEDWELKQLGNIANIQRGASPRPIDSPIWFDKNSFIGWTRISDVNGKYLTKTEQKLSELGVKNSRYVPTNNLIMSICATLGRPAIVKTNICIHDGFVCFYNLKINIEYMYYYLQYIQDDWKNNGQTGSQANLNTDLINSTLISVSKHKLEQQKIAEVLSDVDSLIEKTQQLINKKKDLRIAVMQELLKPKDDWEEKELEVCCFLITKQTGFDYTSTIKPVLKTEKVGSVYSFIQNKDFNGKFFNFNTDYYIPSEIADKFSKIIIDRPSILISISGRIGNVGYYDFPIKSMIGGAVGICKLYEEINGKYIMYYLLSEKGQERILNCVKASSHLNITVDDIRKLRIPFPNKNEQNKIATILSDIDSEIETLEKELNKYKDLKTGMMQQLLTGKVRLI